MQKIIEYTSEMFENIKHIDEDGNEYWNARELQKILDYKEWRKFSGVIKKSKIACENSNYNVTDHFVGADKMVKTGDSMRKVDDYYLSRYACYLITQNGDSRKKIISLAQTYFAVQTRKQELLEQALSEDELRVLTRKKIRSENFDLNKTAIKSGVRNLDRFHNAGYRGLYNGESADDIFKRKKLRYREDILDNMGSEELGANIFRITQTNAKLKNDCVDNEYEANAIHYKIGKEVRKSIMNIGGTMPEKLPTPNKSIKELEKDIK